MRFLCIHTGFPNPFIKCVMLVDVYANCGCNIIIIITLYSIITLYVRFSLPVCA